MNFKRHSFRLASATMLAAALAVAGFSAQANELERPPSVAARTADGSRTQPSLLGSRWLRQTLPDAFLPGLNRAALARHVPFMSARIRSASTPHGALGMRAKRAARSGGPVDASNNLLRLRF